MCFNEFLYFGFVTGKEIIGLMDFTIIINYNTQIVIRISIVLELKQKQGLLGIVVCPYS